MQVMEQGSHVFAGPLIVMIDGILDAYPLVS
jgi:hypothetical protein